MSLSLPRQRCQTRQLSLLSTVLTRLNRPQFSRHSTAAFRTALHTLPAIAGY